MFRSFIRTMSSSNIGPIEQSIQQKLTNSFKPSFLEIRNDSHKHAKHAGMQGASNRTESHFYVKMQSEAFNGINLPSRHRLVYKVLDDEFKLKGLHALQLKLKGSDENLV
ncbi:uvi31 [Candida jiufengensis]|uniref:uvi31 n=1 Tax=Candida jiufengensis TaxID=497108 RepID=UPI00222436B1|nr:uvi31 [Candida jiufengensis]KAI5954257.1 uvi31 [Candida jiufengensis]